MNELRNDRNTLQVPLLALPVSIARVLERQMPLPEARATIVKLSS